MCGVDVSWDSVFGVLPEKIKEGAACRRNKSQRNGRYVEIADGEILESVSEMEDLFETLMKELYKMIFQYIFRED